MPKYMEAHCPFEKEKDKLVPPYYQFSLNSSNDQVGNFLSQGSEPVRKNVINS